MGVIIYNGISSKDYDIQVEHPPGYLSPEKDYNVIHVPGRSGDIIIDQGSYKNVDRSYEIAVGSLDKDFVQLVNPVSEWVHSGTGYCRLEDSYEPEYYRMAVYKEELSIENILFHGGRGTITFNCKPQRFFKSGDRAIIFNAIKTTLGEKLSDIESAINQINSSIPFKISFNEANMLITKDIRTIEQFQNDQEKLMKLENAIRAINSSLPYKIEFSGVNLSVIDEIRTLNSSTSESDAVRINKLKQAINQINLSLPYMMSDTITSITFTDEVRSTPSDNLPDYKGYLNGIINNFTRFDSSPIITVKGNGSCAINIGNYSIIISEVGGSITIDSELMDVYEGSTNKNPYVTLPNGFPKLHPGANNFSYTGNSIVSVEVIPKWWTL